MSRIIALIDMDCFYAQVEQRIRPELWGKPMAVSQISAGGSASIMLAITYEARAFGVKRGMSVKEAKKVCPSLEICMVPNLPTMNKADLSRYKSASDEVFDILTKQESIILEKASVDEAYLDITEAVEIACNAESPEQIIERFMAHAAELFPSTFIADGEDEKLESDQRLARIIKWLDEDCRMDSLQLNLAVGAYLIEKIRKEIFTKTQFQCSAGIGINKIIAKLVCARHKPNQQTIIPPQFVAKVYEMTPINSTMADLQMVPKEQILHEFPEQSIWLFKIMQGNDDEPIRPRLQQKSLAISKNFPGVYKLRSVAGVEKWVTNLSAEFSKRLYEDQVVNQRTALNLTISFRNDEGFYNKTVPLNSYVNIGIINNLLSFMRSYNKAGDKEAWHPPIKNISMSASRFREGVDSQTKQITLWAEKAIQRSLTPDESETKPRELNEPVTSKCVTSTEAKKKRSDSFKTVDHIPQPSTSKQSEQPELIQLDSDDEIGYEIVSSKNDNDLKMERRPFYYRDVVNDEFNENYNEIQTSVNDSTMHSEQNPREKDIPLSERSAIMSRYMPKNLDDLKNQEIKDMIEQLPEDVRQVSAQM
uniref:DNA polymerase eta n=1 Tax=Acrobeloides nanus TaxID=290746 RepID=A0A914D1S3_9BILA